MFIATGYIIISFENIHLIVCHPGCQFYGKCSTSASDREREIEREQFCAFGYFYFWDFIHGFLFPAASIVFKMHPVRFLPGANGMLPTV